MVEQLQQVQEYKQMMRKVEAAEEESFSQEYNYNIFHKVDVGEISCSRSRYIASTKYYVLEYY